MAHSTMEAYEHVRHVDHAGNIADSPSNKKQKSATTVLRDAIPKRDFSVPTAARATKLMGQISRHFVAQILPMICDTARACRPRLAVGILRHSDSTCTVKNKDAELDAMTSRIHSRTATIAPFSTTSSSLPGGMPQSEGTIYFTTSSLIPFREASRKES